MPNGRKFFKFKNAERLKTMPKVSICIPTYNRKKYLKETLDSVFAQTYKDYEIVIVDDGSTDGTEEMIKKCGKTIRYYWQKNAGEAATRNKLIELAQCQFIAFIDSDDLLMPDAVERMVNAIESQPDEVIVYGPYIRIDENGKNCGHCKRKLYSGYITSQLFQEIFVHPNGSIFPKKALQELGGFDTSLKSCPDYDMELRASLKYRFIALSDPTFKRRRHTSNLSSYTMANRIVELDVLEQFYYQKGGKDVIPPKIAMRRLSEEMYRVGKCALREGKFDEAKKYFNLSLCKYPNIKSAFGWVKASVINRLQRSRISSK